MCRNIKTLHNFAPPATEDEIRDALKEAGLSQTGKSVLYDGRTGEAFDILVLPTTSWPRLQFVAREIATAAAALKPGQVLELPL